MILFLNTLINFIMSDSVFSNNRIRAKSAHPKNFTNIELHAHLNEAKGYQEYILFYKVESNIIFHKVSLKTTF